MTDKKTKYKISNYRECHDCGKVYNLNKKTSGEYTCPECNGTEIKDRPKHSKVKYQELRSNVENWGIAGLYC